MNLRKFFVCAALLMPLTGLAQQQRTEHKKSIHDEFSGQGYGTAGCGLGSIIFGKKKGMVQIFAATTNGSFGTQTFGISSGTSNCDDQRSHMALVPFIKTNKNQLENDAAKGSGETLAGLSSLLNCENSAAFHRSLQENFDSIFVNGISAEDLTSNIVSSAQGHCQI